MSSKTQRRPVGPGIREGRLRHWDERRAGRGRAELGGDEGQDCAIAKEFESYHGVLKLRHIKYSLGVTEAELLEVEDGKDAAEKSRVFPNVVGVRKAKRECAEDDGTFKTSRSVLCRIEWLKRKTRVTSEKESFDFRVEENIRHYLRSLWSTG
jgi:hypothetical protein